MKQVNCPICGMKCIKYGKTKAGSQRWFCKHCRTAYSPQIDSDAKTLQIFLKWLFGKATQKEMPGEGRSFRRKTEKFWSIWPMPPKIEEPRNVIFADGIYLARQACVLICRDEQHVLGWYLCREEHADAWAALMRRIAAPRLVVSDGGTGFQKALRRVWPNTKHQRCLFHVACQVKRYVTAHPNTTAGYELYRLSRDLLDIHTMEEAERWNDRFCRWLGKYQQFLSEMTADENGNKRPTHERLVKAEKSIERLIRNHTLFTYLDEQLCSEFKAPSTNNYLEGGVNAQLRTMLREHRGLSVERRIKAVFWWCYQHSPKPLSSSEILKIMPTDQSIAEIYQRLNRKHRVDTSIPGWGDGIVWSELHSVDKTLSYWD